MEATLAALILSLWTMIVCSVQAGGDTYKIRSVYRANLHTDCTLLKVEWDSKGAPSHLTIKGHCCQDKRHSDFEVTKSATNRGLEATFQWTRDPSYYLTAQSTGSPLILEKPSNGVTNKHRFVIKSTYTCSDCVTFQSVDTGKFLASTPDGKITMATNRKLQSTIFQLYRCPKALEILCPFLYVSCKN